MTYIIDRVAAAAGLLLAAAVQAQAPPAEPSPPASLTELTLEELADLEVTSVSRRAQRLLDAPASIYVISGDEIRRAGVTTLPEALRLAPNLQVSALDARRYAVTARGFSSSFANKLLVMVDGRTIYSPLFSGTFWEAQEFVPTDIDRIEVISGPAGAAWGTNAVNGIINVVTRPATETLGASVGATAGTLEQGLGARLGVVTGPGAAVRVHARHFRRDATRLRSGGSGNDASTGSSAGLRADWFGVADAVTLSAGVYRTETDPRPVYGVAELSGGHVLARWARRLGDGSDFELQAYYDKTDRRERLLLQNAGDLFDVEGKWRRQSGAHRWLLGAGYRRADDRPEPGLIFGFLPAPTTQDWSSVFVQDEFAVTPRLTLTLGTRLENNPYTGWEHLPNLRAAYRLADATLLWGALSRAVRSPARVDREIVSPPQPPFILVGGPGFDSEVANVAELGVRRQLGGTASYSATAFVHSYDRLRSFQFVDGAYVLANLIEGEIRGVEAWGEWLPAPHWRLKGGLLWQDRDLRLKPGSNDPTGPSNLGNDPRLQWQLQATRHFGSQVDANVYLRRVGTLPRPRVDAYTAADLVVNWRTAPRVQLSFGVRNAFDARHVEYDAGVFTGEIPRSFFVSVAWQPR